MVPASAPQLLCGVPCRVCTFCRRHTIPKLTLIARVWLAVACHNHSAPLPPGSLLLADKALSMMTWEWWAGSALIRSSAANVCQQSINYGWNKSAKASCSTNSWICRKNHAERLQIALNLTHDALKNSIFWANCFYKPHSDFTDCFIKLIYITKNTTPALFSWVEQCKISHVLSCCLVTCIVRTSSSLRLLLRPHRPPQTSPTAKPKNAH